MQHVNVIDVSDFQDPVDMVAVRDGGYSAVYAKATEGISYLAPTYAPKRAAAKDAGLLFGAYHFLRWDQDALSQALWFVANAKIAPGDLPPMIDCEFPASGTTGLTATQAVALIAATAAAVSDHIGGRRPVLYMDPNFWQTALGSTDGFTGHPLWVADYDVPSAPSLGSWQPTFWQYTEGLTVPGISGNVDGDFFVGTLAELEALRVP